MKASLWIPVTLVLFPACTARNSAYEKKLSQLGENIMILQNERDRLEERIAVLEQERETLAPRPVAQGALERPPLKVVQLVPPDEASGATESPTSTPAPHDEGARTVIRGTGSELSQSPVTEDP
jgi:hypothetical protein